MGLQRENREERTVKSETRLPEQTELEAENVGGGLTGGSLRGLSMMTAPVCLVYIYIYMFLSPKNSISFAYLQVFSLQSKLV